ncbi:ABC transporter substrate-binding protein [Litoribacillus peritrichatus]|uniref:ABC transporter substrate-binding protein n=1 Tax=Litoribacillus peritrichatus TaxID=718191 RepID=A0ABP7M719_9GAMM
MLLCFFVSGCGCSPEPDTEAAQAEDLNTIRLSIDLWPGYYPAVIAHEKGWFKEAGLNLILDMPGDTDKMLAQFSAGAIDAVAVAFGDAVLVTRKMPDVAVILVTDESAGGDAVLAKTPEVMDSLAGKKIGTNLGGFGELLIREMLEKYGLDASHVTIMNVDASKVPDMLDAGELDLAHTWSPYVGLAEQKGAKVVFSSADTPGLIPDTIAIRGELRVNQPEAIKAFIRVWFQAQAWWLKNMEEGNRLIADATHQRVEDISLDGIHLMSQVENIASFSDVDGETGLPNVLTLYNDFYVSRGILRRPADKQILASEFLQ